MAYDKTKDEIVWREQIDDLVVIVCKYNGGPAKVQLSRSFKKKDGSPGIGRVGRLSIEEFKLICSLKKKILAKSK